MAIAEQYPEHLEYHEGPVLVPAPTPAGTGRSRRLIVWVIAAVAGLVLVGATGFITTRYMAARDDLKATRATLAKTAQDLKETKLGLDTTVSALNSTQNSLTRSKAEVAGAKNCLEAIFDSFDAELAGKTPSAKVRAAVTKYCDPYFDAHFGNAPTGGTI